MQELGEYVQRHTVRGECQCGKCMISKGSDTPVATCDRRVDMIFFEVGVAGQPDRETFERLSREAKDGAFASVNPFDGAEHNYMELGAWIGDQGLAMQYMALGVQLGCFQLLSPKTMLPKAMLDLDPSLPMMMAGNGFLSIQAINRPVQVTKVEQWVA